MRKQKIYLDTSAVSHLQPDDVPEKQEFTRKLWERIKNGEYDVYISSVTIYEIEQCKEDRRIALTNYLNEIKTSVIELEDEQRELAEEIIKLGILTRKSIDDCYHIACALTSGCDSIISWNIKHLVNSKTIDGVRVISQIEKYKSIDIYTPEILLGAENNDS
jgi:predicted nucleic acid-binding protein